MIYWNLFIFFWREIHSDKYIRVGLGLEPDENTMKNADIYIGRVTTDIDGNQITEMYDRFAKDVGVSNFLRIFLAFE